jgi:hypothetical protein
MENGKDNKARGVDEGGRWDGGNGDNGNRQRIKIKVRLTKKTNEKPKRSTKGNTRRKIRKGGEE